ncbi:MAG: TldD/PmbA family protein, partial [Candidatus Heimdallarchaeota archaeon]|nr:TldD/PmbA family protein [Candidatus Heimdallarchaeota archaeon]
MYGEMSGKKYFTNSEGTEIFWTPYVLEMRSSVTSRSPITGDLVIGNDLIGGSVGLEFFDLKDCTPEDLGRRSAKYAIEQFDSKPAPSGEFRALVENSLTGVLTHESFGHMSEADLTVTKLSPISDKVGERLGSELVTIVDEGVVKGTSKDVTGFWLPYDDQGIKTERTVVMDEGILKGFLHTRSTAKTMNAKPTGNGRALAFIFPPIPRMKNTYITPGDLTEEEALEQVGKGIYAIGWSGGQANMDGTFSFKAGRAYWVENGEIQYPLKDVALSGHIFDFLLNIEGKTKDFELRATFFGGCGKGGQNGLATGLGGPKVILTKSQFGGQQ